MEIKYPVKLHESIFDPTNKTQFFEPSKNENLSVYLATT